MPAHSVLGVIALFQLREESSTPRARTAPKLFDRTPDAYTERRALQAPRESTRNRATRVETELQNAGETAPAATTPHSADAGSTAIFGGQT